MKHETKIKFLEEIKDMLEIDGHWAHAAMASMLIFELRPINEGNCFNSSCPNNHQYLHRHCFFDEEISECEEFCNS